MKDFIIIILIILGLFGLLAFASQSKDDKSIALIEQKRRDIRKIKNCCSGEIYKDIIDTNQRILNIQINNKTFIGDLLNSDKWDDVKLLEIKELEWIEYE